MYTPIGEKFQVTRSESPEVQKMCTSGPQNKENGQQEIDKTIAHIVPDNIRVTDQSAEI